MSQLAQLCWCVNSLQVQFPYLFLSYYDCCRPCSSHPDNPRVREVRINCPDATGLGCDVGRMLMDFALRILEGTHRPHSLLCKDKGAELWLKHCF